MNPEVSLDLPLAGCRAPPASQHAGADHDNHEKAISSVIGSHWMTAGRQDGDRTSHSMPAMWSEIV